MPQEKGSHLRDCDLISLYKMSLVSFTTNCDYVAFLFVLSVSMLFLELTTHVKVSTGQTTAIQEKVNAVSW